MNSLRPLLRGEVAFDRTTEPDESDWQDSADDDELLAEIRDRLARDDASAWCGVVVTAVWTSETGQRWQGRASLWGCTLTDKYTDEDVAKDHDLPGEALADLNTRLAAFVAQADALREQLASNH